MFVVVTFCPHWFHNERFSICVSKHHTTAKQKKEKKKPTAKLMSQRGVKVKSKTRENAGDQIVIGYSFTSDWLREWRELSGPITNCLKRR